MRKKAIGLDLYNNQLTGDVAMTFGGSRTDQHNIPHTIVMTYQKVTGTLNPGAHPGSYNGQDAYNDLLITDERSMYWKRTDVQHNNAADSEHIGLHARSASHIDKGGKNAGR